MDRLARARPGIVLLGALLFIASVAGRCAEAAPDPPAKSAGCGRPPPQSPPERIVAGGRSRELILAFPPDDDPAVAHDLVIAFHGRTGSAERVRGYYDLESHARRPTLFVYPRGLAAAPGTRNWSDPGDPPAALRDYALFDAILARIASDYCVDRHRVFAVGHSLGATFVNALGCARGAALRGIATVAGGAQALRCAGPTAALLIHNPRDRSVPFALGESVRDLYLRANGLSGAPPAPLAELAQPPAFACRRYGPLAGDPVLWCPHRADPDRHGRDYPHQWPPGTGDLVMAFFAGLR